MRARHNSPKTLTIMIRLFDGASHVDEYVKYRHEWPAEVFQRIVAFLSEKRSPPHQLAVDVACGSGQSTYGLAPWFERVIGFDISEAQIDAATKANSVKHVEFKVSMAEKLPLEDCSVDLVTCAQGVHWLEFDAFFAEARRVLKPGGCLAVYGHARGYPDHADPGVKEMLTSAFRKLYLDELLPFVHERLLILYDSYKDLSIPFEDSLREDQTEHRVRMTLSHVLGLVRSWSSYQRAVDKEPSHKRILEDLKTRVLAAYGTPDASPDEVELDIVYPFILLMGRKLDTK
ncbi:putative methyltransferase DDB_G0268948 [Diadema antillarum]|uniref:putative methyltransferase DDB_G0268948 n=1 Tax=Diadema antillarum TaxID=105358 RepID=UPI003A87FCB4